MRHRIMIRGGEWPPKVSPGKKDVCPGDTVSFEARGTEAQVFFPSPPKWPFVEDWQVVRVAKEEVRAPARVELTVREIAQDQDLEDFPYAVYCSSTNSFAVGDSDPIIIIRRPS